MKNTLLKFILFGSLFSIFSCTSDRIDTKINNSVDIYISGSKNNHAGYWKNNQFFSLTDTGYLVSKADTIIVANNDVHILGSGSSSTTSKQLYWKNNVLTNLTDVFSTSTDVVDYIGSMDVVNNDVFFAGITQNVSIPNTFNLVYWKNGVKNIVSTFSAQYSFYHISIKVVNNDIYITCPNEIGGVLTDGYYFNGVFFPINNVNLWGCDLINTNMYVFGSESQYPTGYYKNIVTNTVTSFQTISPLTHICFDSGSVYCSDDLTVFKDGILFYSLTSSNTIYNRIHSFEIMNNSFYLLTEENNISANNLVQKLLVDSLLFQQNAVDEQFNSLFLVQN